MISTEFWPKIRVLLIFIFSFNIYFKNPTRMYSENPAFAKNLAAFKSNFHSTEYKA